MIYWGALFPRTARTARFVSLASETASLRGAADFCGIDLELMCFVELMPTIFCQSCQPGRACRQVTAF